MPGARTEAQRGRVLAPAPSFLFIWTRGERTFRACVRRAVSITDTMRASSKRKNGPHGACSRHRNLGCKLPIAFVAHRTLCLKEPDAGVRTSLFQIKRRACGGRPMTAAAARRRVFVRGEGGTRRCIVIDTCSFRDSSPKMCSRHGPSSFFACPRSFNQALLLSTRWMFGRVNRMVVIGRFGAFFGRRLRRTLRRAWVKRSAHRCDGLHAALMAMPAVCCEAAVWSAVVSQRVRAIGHCLQRSMRAQRQAH